MVIGAWDLGFAYALMLSDPDGVNAEEGGEGLDGFGVIAEDEGAVMGAAVI